MTRLVLKSGKEILVEDAKALYETTIEVKHSDKFIEIYGALSKDELSDFEVMFNDKLVGRYHLFECKSATFDGKYGVYKIAPIGTEEDPSVITVIEEVPDDYSEAGRILLGEEE